MLDELLIVPTVITSVHSVRIACEQDRRQDRERRAEALDDAGPSSEEMRGGLSSRNSPTGKLSPPFLADSRRTTEPLFLDIRYTHLADRQFPMKGMIFSRIPPRRPRLFRSASFRLSAVDRINLRILGHAITTEYQSGLRHDSTGSTWIARLPAIVEQSRERVAHVAFQNRC